jgi:hypothetical protein
MHEEVHLHVMEVERATLLLWNALELLLGYEKTLALIEGISSKVLVKEFEVRKQTSMLSFFLLLLNSFLVYHQMNMILELDNREWSKCEV